MRHGKLYALLLCTLTSQAFAATSGASEIGAIEVVNLTSEVIHLNQAPGIAKIYADSAGTQPIPGMAVNPGQRGHLYVQPTPLHTPAALFGTSSGKACLIVARDTPASHPTPPTGPVHYDAKSVSGGATCTVDAAPNTAGVTWAATLTVR